MRRRVLMSAVAASPLATLIALGGVMSPSQAQADVVNEPVLVRLGPGTDVATTAAEHMAATGGHVTAILDDTIKGYAGVIPVDQISALRGLPDVVAVEHAEPVAATAVEQLSAPWNLDRIDQRTLPLSTSYVYDTTGAGVDVYVVDSGIDTENADFAGRAIPFGNYSTDISSADEAGHGTAIASIVGSTPWGVAKGVRLFAVKVLDSAASGSTLNAIYGLEAILDYHTPEVPAVVNLSFGGEVSEVLDAAVQALIDSGVTVVVAAGNDGVDACDRSPARVAAAITVGASDTHDARAAFSNYGSCVDIFAPGVDIPSTGSRWSGHGPVLTASGTSQAAPHVAGAAARYLQDHPSATPAQVATQLKAAATQGVLTDSRSGDAGLLYVGPPDAGPSAVVSAFRAPVDASPVRNTAQAGRTIPFAFTATDPTGKPLLGLNADDVTAVTALSPTCVSAPLDSIESYTAADPGKLINLGGGTYQYNLKTAKAWAGKCGQVGLKVLGTVRTADFAFRS